MKATLSLIFLLLFINSAFSQMQVQDRLNLQNLLAERAKNFSEYTSSIQKRSGIFGNKTKKDLEKSNEILIGIVTLDNSITDALNRALQYKTFEKTSDNYDVMDCQLKLKQSMEVTDTLLKQMALLERKVKDTGSPAAVYKVLVCFFLFFSAFLLYKIRQLRATR